MAQVQDCYFDPHTHIISRRIGTESIAMPTTEPIQLFGSLIPRCRSPRFFHKNTNHAIIIIKCRGKEKEGD